MVRIGILVAAAVAGCASDVPANHWERLGDNVVTDGAGVVSAIVLDPVTNAPIVAYHYATEIGVSRWSGTRWDALPAVPHEYRGEGTLALALDSTGAVILAFADSEAGVASYIRVKRFSDGAWTQMGPDLETDDGQNPSMVVDSLDQPIVAWSNGNSVKSAWWGGSSWTPLGPPLVGDGDHRPSIALGTDGRPVLAIETTVSLGTGTVVRRWDGSMWQSLGDPVGSQSASGASSVLAVDADGSLVVAHRVGIASPSIPGLRVDRYDGTAWHDLGEEVTREGDSLDGHAIAIGGGSIVAVFATITPTSYDLVARQWRDNAWETLDEPIEDPAIANGMRPAVVVDTVGDPYIAYEAENDLVVKHYGAR